MNSTFVLSNFASVDVIYRGDVLPTVSISKKSFRRDAKCVSITNEEWHQLARLLPTFGDNSTQMLQRLEDGVKNLPEYRYALSESCLAILSTYRVPTSDEQTYVTFTVRRFYVPSGTRGSPSGEDKAGDLNKKTTYKGGDEIDVDADIRLLRDGIGINAEELRMLVELGPNISQILKNLEEPPLKIEMRFHEDLRHAKQLLDDFWKTANPGDYRRFILTRYKEEGEEKSIK